MERDKCSFFFSFKVLGQYIENLMAASSVFQPANGDPHPPPSSHHGGAGGRGGTGSKRK